MKEPIVGNWKSEWSKAQNSIFFFFLSTLVVYEEMETHSSILVWKITWTERLYISMILKFLCWFFTVLLASHVGFLVL